MFKSIINFFKNDEKHVASIYLRTINPDTMERDIDASEAMEWIEKAVPGVITSIVRAALTDPNGKNYGAPVVHLLLTDKGRSGLKDAVKIIKSRYNRPLHVVKVK